VEEEDEDDVVEIVDVDSEDVDSEDADSEDVKADICDVIAALDVTGSVYEWAVLALM